MKIKYIASSRHKNSTTFIQVVYNQVCIYSSMSQKFLINTAVPHLVAESYKCKLRTLQGLNGCAVLHRMLKRNMFNMVHEIYKMTDKQQTRAKSKLVLTDTKRIKVAEDKLPTELIIRNVHISADKSYKHVHPMSMKYIKSRSNILT